MSRQTVFQFLLIVTSTIQLLGEGGATSIDRIEVTGGAVLTGRIVDANEEAVQLQTDYAGLLEVMTSQIQRIVTDRKLVASIPADLIVVPEALIAQNKASPDKPAQEKPKETEQVAKPDAAAPVAAKSTPAKADTSDKATPEKSSTPPKGPTKPPVKSTATASNTPAKPPVKKPPAKQPAPTNDKYGWEIEAGMNLAGNAGNSDKLDLAINVDTQYEQKFYRLDLYARYSYGTNRDKLTSNEIVLGSRYTNFFYKKFGFFIREELEHDKFEGIDFRSTSAAGFSYKLYDNKVLDFEARSGLSYRFEEDDQGEEEDFPGMDFGVDVRWQFNPYLSFKGSYSFIPSFTDSEAFIITQNSGVDIPFDRKSQWKIRLGLTTKYNNKPSKKRDNMDHKYYIRLIATWK